MMRKLYVWLVVLLMFILSGCMEKLVEPSAKTENKMEELLPPYHALKPRLLWPGLSGQWGKAGAKPLPLVDLWEVLPSKKRLNSLDMERP